jgi:hypothetical protein
MKVSGFTFIRNAIKYDYPIVEAIRSILPVSDEVVKRPFKRFLRTYVGIDIHYINYKKL